MKALAIVFLIIFMLIIGMAGSLGNLVGGTELFNPARGEQEAYILGTRSAVEIIATQANWSATQTPLVAQVQAHQTQVAQPVQMTQTSVAVLARSTEIARGQAATLEAGKSEIAQQGIAATRSALAGKQWMDGQILSATQQALEYAKERDVARAKNDELLAAFRLAFQILLVILLVLLIVLITLREAPKLAHKPGGAARKSA